MSRSKNYKKISKFSVLLVSVGVVALGFSVVGFAREYRFAITLRGTEEAQVVALVGFDAQDLPWGAHDLRGLLTACADLQLTSTLVRVVPRYQTRLADSCTTIVRDVLAVSPANARARASGLVAAGAAMTASDYALAQAAAPFEPWPLGTRLLAINQAFEDAVPADLLPLIAADADRAIREHWGRLILARLYVNHPALRPLLTKVAQGRPAEEQRAFLDASRREAAADG